MVSFYILFNFPISLHLGTLYLLHMSCRYELCTFFSEIIQQILFPIFAISSFSSNSSTEFAHWNHSITMHHYQPPHMNSISLNRPHTALKSLVVFCSGKLVLRANLLQEKKASVREEDAGTSWVTNQSHDALCHSIKLQ